jgi:hypothetical protein
MNDFLFLADSYEDALLLRQRVQNLLDSLGLQRNPKKGVWTPTQVGDHLGLTVDLQRGMFRALPQNYNSSHSTRLPSSVARHRTHDGCPHGS